MDLFKTTGGGHRSVLEKHFKMMGLYRTMGHCICVGLQYNGSF